MILRYFSIFTGFLLLFFFSSCKQNLSGPLPENALLVKVSHQAGSPLDEEAKFLGLPGNMCEILNLQNENKCLVLSKPIRKGVKLHVLPIGVLRLDVDEEALNIVLTYPIDTSLQTITAVDMDEFATIHSSAKWIIEQWFLNHKGMGRVSVKGWESKEYVVNNILNK